MANWITNQKAKRLMKDMPLDRTMTSSGGAHNQNKGYGDSDGPPMMSKGPHTTGHGKDNESHYHATKQNLKTTNREPVKKLQIENLLKKLA